MITLFEEHNVDYGEKLYNKIYLFLKEVKEEDHHIKTYKKYFRELNIENYDKSEIFFAMRLHSKTYDGSAKLEFGYYVQKSKKIYGDLENYMFEILSYYFDENMTDKHNDLSYVIIPGDVSFDIKFSKEDYEAYKNSKRFGL